ncbi:hypothetical protein [Spirosoma endbachense]|uniref:Uncharacterized protein n=1 Tax=Spirosoma endbachense TaxID=2666025 RepID=A0A6P1VMG0_9BACT|nr:hypothetical protein [Spirosoma endbachense]QHV93764.1 hypothetical protein GJR95_01400 [Spirosoma endbachense]
MWWKKTKTYSKQILKDANLDPVPYAKDRLRSEFAKTLLDPLPVEQIDIGDSVEFKVEAILLSVSQWQDIKERLSTLSGSTQSINQDAIVQLINDIENK